MNDIGLFLQLPVAAQIGILCFVAFATGLFVVLLAAPRRDCFFLRWRLDELHSSAKARERSGCIQSPELTCDVQECLRYLPRRRCGPLYFVVPQAFAPRVSIPSAPQS